MVGMVVAALSLPDDTRVDQRVPKKLLLEQGMPTAADKRYVQNGIEDLIWIAALKPTMIGVPEYRDGIREYLEIAVLTLHLRPKAKAQRIVELIHRSIPYPVALIAGTEEGAELSFAHKRNSQAEKGKTVAEGIVTAVLANPTSLIEQAFLSDIALSRQPSKDLHVLYQGLIDKVETLSAARITGHYGAVDSANEAADRRKALEDYEWLQREIGLLKGKAAKERQINRRVELNLEIRRLEGKLTELAGKL
jgi:hypothetical protein